METLSGYLTGLRRGRQLSLGQLGLRADVNKATLSRWEAGTYWPRVPELLRVLDALEVSQAERSRGLTLLDAPRAVLALRDDAGAPAMHVSLGDLLYSLRRRAGKSQADVARTAGVSRSLVSQWENDAARPTEGQLHAAGYALGVSAEEIAVLSTRDFARTPLGKTREALLDAYRDFGVTTEAEDRLTLLTLLGGFGRLLRTDAGDPGDLALVVSTLANHVEMWHNDRRQRDIYHGRALVLAAAAREPLHFHIARSTRVLLDAKSNPRPLGERVSSALEWEHRFRSRAGRAYLLSFLAGALAPDAPDEALRLGDQYCALVSDDPDEYPCRLHDRGNLLRRCGRPAEAVAHLAALTPQDTYREGLVYLDMAQGFTDLGARIEVGYCLTKARRVLSGTETAMLQARFVDLERAVQLTRGREFSLPLS